MYDLLFKETAEALRAFLFPVFSSLTEDWWTIYVVNRLSPDQKRMVAENKVNNLNGLDLQALLNIFDQNWKDISRIKFLPNEARNYLKEIQSIRNRWAHASDRNNPNDDICRHLETLERLLKYIEADSVLIAKVAKKKELERRIEEERIKEERKREEEREKEERKKEEERKREEERKKEEYLKKKAIAEKELTREEARGYTKLIYILITIINILMWWIGLFAYFSDFQKQFLTIGTGIAVFFILKHFVTHREEYMAMMWIYVFFYFILFGVFDILIDIISHYFTLEWIWSENKMFLYDQIIISLVFALSFTTKHKSKA